MRGMRKSTSSDGSVGEPGSRACVALLHELLEPGRVICNAKARSRKHALEILSKLLSDADMDLSQAEIFEALVAREKLGSTGLPDGVAMPHGRIRGIGDTIGAFLKLVRPIDHDTPDGRQVDLILGLIVPANCAADQESEIATLVSTLADSRFCATLRDTKSIRALYQLLTAHVGAQADNDS